MSDDNFFIFEDTTALPIETETEINIEPKRTYITDDIILDKTRHEAVVPLDKQKEYTNIQILPEYPCKKYDFNLDTFQKLALSSIHLNHSVMVSAHTSSGKTVIAEYAIAMSLQNSQRCIYTSPIKALSNQKYRELQELYQDVGLITGDVTLNPNASCLVMTTEILRNMLYRGSEIMREVKWIVFDEIHYIKEKERGVVWEECIIMSPKDVRMVFLSATVPNAIEFAEWVSEVTEGVVHVIYTEKRPTPLEHYLNVKGNTDLVKILYEKNNKAEQSREYYKTESHKQEYYNEKCGKQEYYSEKYITEHDKVECDREKYYKHKKDVKRLKKSDHKISENEVSSEVEEGEIKKIEIYENDQSKETDTLNENKNTRMVPSSSYFDKKAFAEAIRSINGKQRIEESDVKNVVKNLIEQDCLPTIVFSFSRKECEKYALSIDNDFLNEKERETINLIFTNALMNLREEDRNLPLITNLLPLLLKGIGIHHSGLLPILKEIVEILFQEGLIKVLFATETFSIGLNMPARSVVFTNLSKFDGEERRILSSGEYIQMSGRAGRRGIDKKGIVVAMLSDVLNLKKGERLFSGLADKLVSAFRLSYNMILNLMRVEGLDTLYLLERSFYHYQSKRGREEMFYKINEMKDKIAKIETERKKIIKKYSKKKSNQKSNSHKSKEQKTGKEILAEEQSSVKNFDSKSNKKLNKKPNEENKFFIFDEEKLNTTDKNLKIIFYEDNLIERIDKIKNVNDIHPLQIYNLMLGYEKLRVRRNTLREKFYLNLLEPGRVIDIFVPRRGSPFLLQNCIVGHCSKKEVFITATLDGNLIKKKFPLKCIDVVFDSRVKNLKGLQLAVRRGLDKINIDDLILENPNNKQNNNKKQKDNTQNKKAELSEVKIIHDEITYLNEILYILEDLLSVFNKVCLFCGSKIQNPDCLSDRCFDEEDLEIYFKNENIKHSIFNELRKIFLEEKYKKLYENSLLNLKELNEIYHMEECRKMIQVLRRLEYCDENSVLTKGRVACEISTGDELLLTEMMFNGDFISLPVEEVVPLLSCIVFPEWDNESTLSDKNNENYKVLKEMVEKITGVMKDCGIDIDLSTVLKKYSYEMMDVVEMWVRGYSFVEICNKTNIFEGTIIRCFRRLEELLKQMASAARNIGNTELENLFALGISKIKRDIVFASSLYL